jgi:hypothetical protein
VNIESYQPLEDLQCNNMNYSGCDFIKCFKIFYWKDMGDLCHNFVQWVWTRIVSCWPVQKIFLLMTCPVIITDSFYKNHIQNPRTCDKPCSCINPTAKENQKTKRKVKPNRKKQELNIDIWLWVDTPSGIHGRILEEACDTDLD